jgi:hypothetical protein
VEEGGCLGAEQVSALIRSERIEYAWKGNSVLVAEIVTNNRCRLRLSTESSYKSTSPLFSKI